MHATFSRKATIPLECWWLLCGLWVVVPSVGEAGLVVAVCHSCCCLLVVLTLSLAGVPGWLSLAGVLLCVVWLLLVVFVVC